MVLFHEKIVKPNTIKEKRDLKNGLIEDDNEDIAYLNLRLIFPILITYIISGICIIMSLYLGFNEEIYDSTPKNNPKGDIHLLKYGSLKYICKERNPPKPNEIPSFLRLIELKSQTNMWLRYSVIVPWMIRFFVTYCSKQLIEDHTSIKNNTVASTFNSISPYILFFEIFFCSLFSIVTIRHDFPEFMNISLHMFVYLAIIYMFIHFFLCAITLPENFNFIDVISLLSKFISASAFCYFGHTVLNHHLSFMVELGCHPYVPYEIGINEYIALTAYIIYHFSHVTEIRNLRFICYPRTSSGECEPIREENFAKGGKYEYCRSFELRQRQILQNDVKEWA
uniref:Post-GPI attachment to proteins factor 3 n=1 Tax=Parastrongyloides trichosuri TaxID=131310 RepID=A0A0N5A270_PARTI